MRRKILWSIVVAWTVSCVWFILSGSAGSRSVRSIPDYEMKLFFMEIRKLIVIVESETGSYPGCADGTDHQFALNSAFVSRYYPGEEFYSLDQKILSKTLDRLDRGDLTIHVYLDGDGDGKLNVNGVDLSERIAFSPSTFEY